MRYSSNLGLTIQNSPPIIPRSMEGSDAPSHWTKNIIVAGSASCWSITMGIQRLFLIAAPTSRRLRHLGFHWLQPEMFYRIVEKEKFSTSAAAVARIFTA